MLFFGKNWKEEIVWQFLAAGDLQRQNWPLSFAGKQELDIGEGTVRAINHGNDTGQFIKINTTRK